MLRKKIAIAIIAGAGVLLLAGGMAGAEGVFPEVGNEIEYLPALETYADRHANEAVGATGTAPSPCFPSVGNEIEYQPAPETYADRHANEAVGATGTEAPGNMGAIPDQHYNCVD